MFVLRTLVVGMAAFVAVGCLSGSRDAGGADTRPDALDEDLGDALDEVDGEPAIADCLEWSQPERSGVLPDVIAELSGLAATGDQGALILWGHNDSGDSARVFAFTPSGELLATVDLDVPARDFEDMAVGPCGSTRCLYVGDIGDNLRRHSSVRVHRFPIPDLELDLDTPAHLPAHIEASPETAVFTYADGPRDAEALMVGEDESIWILEKSSGVARAWSALFAAGSTSTLELRGELDLSPLPAGASELATAADWSADRSAIIVRTYSTVALYALEAPLEVGTELTVGSVVRAPTGPELQGEAVAWTPDGYVHAAEGSRSPIWQVRCEGAAH